MFKVSFFIREKEQELFPMLEPLNFTIHRDHKVVYQGEKYRFIIQPFSVVGRESQGYRAYYNGNPDSFQYLFDHALGCFSPTISGVEYTFHTDKSQSELVKTAVKAKYKKGSVYGLFENQGIGIVIMPTGQVILQVKNRLIKRADLARVMYEIKSVVDMFNPQDFNLFSFMEKEEGVQVS
ncbi:hypothetical protein B14911_10672 [Bacillus sp. NRRL B-14911]|uniref:hypothetical protein n=1 Tax=Bacillus sp. NRRL B-14911 TaxID=313627 RepID=UPI00006B5985|nr:hypothetical protein [Bacillus sp. NRRL B-14911]EAR66192.1 hypothetical protein B14911_10672 [Bacillus sp. NRRL B-14911]